MTVADPPKVLHDQLRRAGAKAQLRLLELPPWHGWHYRSVAARAQRWIERYLRIPTGHNAGQLMRLAPFQREILKAIYDDGRGAFVSLPAGNTKTTLLAAVALERVCRGDDYAEVDVVATKQEQAGRLVDVAKRMVEHSPELVELFAYWEHHGILEYRPTGSRIQAHPAKLSAVQGLNFSLAVVDEIGFASDAIVESLIARVGKRADAAVVGVGTPGFEPNVMFRLRELAEHGDLPASVRYLEWTAPAGCDVHDRKAWRKANPALRAGILSEDALAVQAAILPEREFRVYHLAQWVDGAAGWLPVGAWDACPYQAAPADGTEVVLAVEGTYLRTMAVVGATLDGAVFFGRAAETATDDWLRAVLDAACQQWNVVEIVHAPRIRPHVFRELAETGDVPVVEWSPGAALDMTSAGELYRAILEQRVAHDHDELVGAHIGRLVTRATSDGSLRLGRPADGGFVDAGLAARMAWWRAAELADTLEPAIY